ncbi:MAG: M20 family metallo-hydrolase [Mycobacteriales bacterium]
MTVEKLEISTERFSSDLTALAGLVDDTRPGWTRTALSETERAGRSWLIQRMQAAGLDVRVDVAGNVIGTLAGRRGGPYLVTGSHIDTVDGGGRYDGMAGTLGAIEAVEAMAEAGIGLDHPLRVVGFFGEEANEFGLAHFGSRAIAGTLLDKHLALTNSSGQTLAQALSERADIDPERCMQARWSPSEVAAYVELHIEQGPLLEHHGRSIGLVTGIAGAQRFVASFSGRADHAGSTPMNRRRDALCAAATLALSVEHVAHDNPGGVATVGDIKVTPGASNVVPGHAELIGDMRSLDQTWLSSRRDDFERAGREAGADRSVNVCIAWPSVADPVLFTDPVQRVIGGAIKATGHDPLPITSGAGHDAQEMATLGPGGMIFVPSREGRSHCPEEHTELSELTAGVQVLVEALVAFDRSLT